MLLIDQLSRLPEKVRSCILSHYLDFENISLRVRQKHDLKDQKDATLSSVLELLDDPRYIHRRQCNTHQRWPDNVERAFFEGLDWSSRHPATQQGGFRKLSYSHKTVSMIIFELTGDFRCQKAVSSHYQVLERVLDAVYPGVDSIRDDIIDLTPELQYTNTDDLIEDLVKRIQDKLTDLLSALEARRTSVVETTTAPHFNFRFVGTYLLPSYFPFQPAIIERDSKIPANDLSLMRVSRFYRAECFATLAPKMIYDFGFDVEALQDFSKAVSPAMLNSITQVRVTFVEGHMLTLPPLPELKMLHIDLWPRDPARSDSVGRAWGEQTETLLESLQTWAGTLKVRLEMRWRDDCERFEREYVTNGAWGRVLEDVPEDRSSGNKDFCHRFYEL